MFNVDKCGEDGPAIDFFYWANMRGMIGHNPGPGLGILDTGMQLFVYIAESKLSILHLLKRKTTTEVGGD